MSISFYEIIKNPYKFIDYEGTALGWVQATLELQTKSVQHDFSWKHSLR